MDTPPSPGWAPPVWRLAVLQVAADCLPTFAHLRRACYMPPRVGDMDYLHCHTPMPMGLHAHRAPLHPSTGQDIGRWHMPTPPPPTPHHPTHPTWTSMYGHERTHTLGS